jgi:hypothetical protein
MESPRKNDCGRPFALTLGNKSTRDRNRGTRNGTERERERTHLLRVTLDSAALSCGAGPSPPLDAAMLLSSQILPLSIDCFFTRSLSLLLATPSPVSCNASNSSYEVITSLKNPSSPPPSPRGMLATRKENTNARARAHALWLYSWPPPKRPRGYRVDPRSNYRAVTTW